MRRLTNSLDGLPGIHVSEARKDLKGICSFIIAAAVSNFAQPSRAARDDKAVCPEDCAHLLQALEPDAIQQRPVRAIPRSSFPAKCPVHERGIHEEHTELSTARQRLILAGQCVANFRAVQALHPEHQRTRAVVTMYCITGMTWSCGNVKAENHGKWNPHSRCSSLAHARTFRKPAGRAACTADGSFSKHRRGRMASNPLSNMLFRGTTKADVRKRPHSRCSSHVTERSRVQQHRQNDLRKTIGSPLLRVRAWEQGVPKFTGVDKRSAKPRAQDDWLAEINSINWTGS